MQVVRAALVCLKSRTPKPYQPDEKLFAQENKEALPHRLLCERLVDRQASKATETEIFGKVLALRSHGNVTA